MLCAGKPKRQEAPQSVVIASAPTAARVHEAVPVVPDERGDDVDYLPPSPSSAWLHEALTRALEHPNNAVESKKKSKNGKKSRNVLLFSN